MISFKKPAAVGAAVLGMLAASPAQACTLCSCSATATDLSFGSYDPLSSTAKTATSTVAVSCNGLLPLLGTVDISLGSGLSGNVASRTMKKGTDTLNYNVYRESALATVLGDGSGGSFVISRNMTALLFYNSTSTLYGRIPQGQWVAPGAYSDILIVTIIF